MAYQPTIGLEIHVELKTKSKMFCSCLNDAAERRPNVNVCPVCMGHPGTLPVINEEAVKKVLKTGLALNSVIQEHSKFDRKNYFYPDLPKGYQISQYDTPLCQGGFLTIGGKKIDITRVHLEEDTGRLIHPKGADYSLVDFNRSGVPLMELVTEPDITSAKEARRFAEELQLILRYLGVSDADMEKGQMRVEANISLSKGGKMGTKVEIKNLNSFRSVEYGINYELERQEKLLEAGKKVIQETRGWDAAKEVTVSQREKEAAHDYRYFPEPDLPPMQFGPDDVKKIRSEIPELPQEKREKFRKDGLEEGLLEILVNKIELANFFEEISPRLNLNQKKIASHYLTTDLLGTIKDVSKKEVAIIFAGVTKDVKKGGDNFIEFVKIVDSKKISSKIAKELFSETIKTGKNPLQIIEEKGLVLITDEKEIEEAVKKVIAQNSQAAADYKKGKGNALQFLIGKVMQETRGQASPEIANKVLRRALDKI